MMTMIMMTKIMMTKMMLLDLPVQFVCCIVLDHLSTDHGHEVDSGPDNGDHQVCRCLPVDVIIRDEELVLILRCNAVLFTVVTEYSSSIHDVVCLDLDRLHITFLDSNLTQGWVLSTAINSSPLFKLSQYQ